MEYSIKKLALLAGVTTRTLRYYDEIGILKPARINTSGYRIYGRDQVDRLQQIMLYKEMGVALETIHNIMTKSDFDETRALTTHLKGLLAQREQLDQLIENVKRTIDYKEGKCIMNDKEKFEGFKQNLVAENESKYGEEIRKKYGEEEVNRSNQKMLQMSEEEYKALEQLGEEVLDILEQALETGNPGGELGQKAASLHKKWLSYSWAEYNKEAHAGLAQMYVDDERFKRYYDKRKDGMAEFLRDAIIIYTGKMK